MNKEQFVLEVRNLGIEVTEKKLKKLDEFYNLIFARMLGLPRASTIYKSLGIRYVSFK